VVDAGFDYVAAVFDDVESGIADAWSWITNTWDTVAHIVTVDIPEAYDYAANFATVLYHDALRYGDEILHDAEGWINDLAHEIEAASDWVIKNIADPVFNWIDHAADFVGHLIESAWDGFYRDVVKPIADLLHEVYQWADVLWGWYWKVAADVIETCIKAFDWLVWFALHPYAGFEEIVHDALNEYSLEYIVKLANSADDYLDPILEDFARAIA